MPAIRTSGHLVLEARYPAPQDLLQILTTQRRRQLDVVASATKLTMRGGVLHVANTEAAISASGVTPAGGAFRPLRGFDNGLADRLPGVPRKWIDWTRANRLDLYDDTINGLWHGGVAGDGTSYPPSDKRYLVRLFRGDTGQPGYARAFLSNSYQPIDHLDIWCAAMDVINAKIDDQIRETLGIPADVEVTDANRQMFTAMHPGGAPGIARGVEVRAINLTEDAMHIRMLFPGISTSAPALAGRYRSPFRNGGLRRANGWQPPQHPRPQEGDIVWAGIDLLNNTIGEGSYWITPVVGLCVCDNGQVITKEAIKKVHLGGKLDEGTIDWSEETRQAAMRLALAQTKDAMSKFVEAGYLERAVAGLEGRAEIPLGDPAETLKVVQAKCQFTDGQAEAILRAFTLSAQITAGGVANAVTAVAQTVASPAEAIALDYKAVQAMDAAADHALTGA